MLDEVIHRFNDAATELQKSEFCRPRTWDELHGFAKHPPPHDYAKLFNVFVPMIESFAALDEASERADIGSKLNLDAVGILRTFASTMAVLAVRRASPTLIAQGLTALAILGETDDYRDLCYDLATLHHSALKLGMDTAKLFGETAELASSKDLRREMQRFPLRVPKDRELSAFGLREVVAEEGYDFFQYSL